MPGQRHRSVITMTLVMCLTMTACDDAPTVPPRVAPDLVRFEGMWVRPPSDTVEVNSISQSRRYGSVRIVLLPGDAPTTWVYSSLTTRGDTLIMRERFISGPPEWRYVLTDGGDSLRAPWTTTPGPAFGRVRR